MELSISGRFSSLIKQNTTKKERKEYQSVSRKFIFTVSLISIFFFAALAFFMIHLTIQSHEKVDKIYGNALNIERSNENLLYLKGLSVKGKNYITILKEGAGKPVAQKDTESLKLLVDGMMKDPDVAFVNFSSKNLENLTEKRSASNSQLFNSSVFYRGEEVGFVEIGMNKNNVMKDINAITARINITMDKSKKESMGSRKSMILSVTAISILCVIVLSATILFLLNFYILKPIIRTRDMIRDIAEGDGDLTLRLQSRSNDEIGELTRWFNIFVDNLQKIIGDISNSAGFLEKSSVEMTSLSGSISDITHEMYSNTENVTKSVNEISADTHEVAEKMEIASSNLTSVAGSSSQMHSTISEIAKNAESASRISKDAVTHIDSASQNVSKLGTSVKDIGDVAGLIADISSQTNLLALNATIEAARAGDAGRGFAVVANEIKELAKQTEEATNSIKNNIQSIQETSGMTIEEISGISKVINNVNDIVTSIASAVEEQSVSTEEISGNVMEASGRINDVNTKIARNSEHTELISSEITEVNSFAEKLKANSSNVNDKATELSKIAIELNRLVSKFRV